MQSYCKWVPQHEHSEDQRIKVNAISRLLNTNGKFRAIEQNPRALKDLLLGIDEKQIFGFPFLSLISNWGLF